MIKLSAFGDSVLKGIVLENDKYKHSNACFINIIKAELGADIENKGKFGSTVSVGRRTVEKNLESLKNTDSEYVFMEFGGNDCDFNWEEISENPDLPHKPQTDIREFFEVYTKMINTLKGMGKKPIILSLPPIDAKRYFDKISKGQNADNILKWLSGNKQHITDWHEMYNLETFKIAIANKIPIIDITSKFLELNDYSRFLCDDGIHPNDKGHKIIAETIIEYMREQKIVPCGV